MRTAARRGGRRSFAGRWAWMLLIAAAATPASAGERGARAVEGSDRARVLPPRGAQVADYRNAGYRLRWVGDEVSVEVDNAPLGSRSGFELPPAAAGDAVSRLARGLTAGAETRYEAISRILGWVARHLEYELDRSQPQSAEAVLARRSGYCTGVARLTVALLAAVAIEAREVAGYVVGGGPDRANGYHRWIEAYLPDRGWVFSDPLATHHWVPATYLRLAAEDLSPADGTDGLLLERHDEVVTVDLYPLAAPGVTARRNSARQLAAALRVRLTDHGRGTAILEGARERRTHALIDGATTFVGLDPGSYELRLVVPGKGVFESSVELPGRTRKALAVTTSQLRADRLLKPPPRAADAPSAERD